LAGFPAVRPFSWIWLPSYYTLLVEAPFIAWGMVGSFMNGFIQDMAVLSMVVSLLALYGGQVVKRIAGNEAQ